jgi:hypothetical protein
MAEGVPRRVRVLDKRVASTQVRHHTIAKMKSTARLCFYLVALLIRFFGRIRIALGRSIAKTFISNTLFVSLWMFEQKWFAIFEN